MNADNEFVSGACSAYEAMLEDYLDGALDNAGSRWLTDHLKGCVGCSHALEAASAASQWLRQAEPTPDPGPGFARIVMARIRQEEDAQGRTSFWEPFVSLAWKFATTAALALVVMVAYASHRANSTAINVAVAGQSELQDMLMPSQSTVPANRSDFMAMVTESDNAER
jgi:predicted anti-sigma-YlaC factor YlaD